MKNESNIIDGLNEDQVYEDKKKTYMKRALALVLICQLLQISDSEFHILALFNIQTFKLKACFIPPQKDSRSCGVKVMMAIY